MPFEEVYDISEYGFLPSNPIKSPPLKWKFLQPIIDDFDLTGQKFRSLVDSNISRSTDSNIKVLDLPNIKFIYSFYSIMIHKYIWCCGIEDRTTVLPYKLFEPWDLSAKILGLPTVLTHASVDLYNWSLKDPSQPFELDNLQTNFKMTNLKSEEWFYLIMVAIEGLSGRSIKKMFYASSLTDEELFQLLIDVEIDLKTATSIIKRIYEFCDPAEFFNILRIYLTGSDKLDMFKDGLQVQGTDRIVKFKGGSAAQSSLIQMFDIFLGIEHEQEHVISFMQEMRDIYMPSKHRNLLNDFERKHYDLASYVRDVDCQDLTNQYNKCVRQLKAFRSSHVNVVHRYIIDFIPKSTTNIHQNKGTGGTDLNGFVRDVVSNTEDSLIYKNSDFTYKLWMFVIMYAFVWWCVWLYVQYKN